MLRINKAANYRQELQEYSRRLEILHETALLINQAESEGQIYVLLLEQLGSFLRFDSASVLLVEDECLRLAASIGFPASYVENDLRIPLTERTPSLQVVREGQSRRVDDMHRSYPDFASDSPATASKITSWLGVPLTWKNKTIGQIALDRWRVEPFAEDDMRLATIIASHAAGAIERIRLHTEVVKANEQLEQRVAQRTAEIEQAQAAIRSLAERLELATHTAGIGVWDCDLTTGALFMDRNMRRLFQLPPEGDQQETLPDWLSYIHPDDRAPLQESIAQAIQAAQVYDTRFRVVLPNGDDRHIHSSGAIMRGPHNIAQRMIGVCTDVTTEWVAETQRRQTQENLRKSEERLRLSNTELERASRLKDEFLANVSHELRTPLNTILILSETLYEGTYGAVNDRQLQALTDVMEGGRHLLALINDILDLSKIEAGKMDLQFSVVNIADVCRAALRLVRELAIQKKQDLLLLLSADTQTLWADEQRLKQMLVNLLSNAVKFTAEGGRISLQARLDATAGEVRFIVHDTGIGIAPDRLQYLFQPFSQLDSTLSRKYGGTGLGLALVRRLAELHGGRVEVQSDAQTGTRFTIVLPGQAGMLDDGRQGAASDQENSP